MRIVQARTAGHPGPEEALVDGLAALTLGCVRDGDSIGWLAEVTQDELVGWWRDLVADPHVVTWCALDADGTVEGTVSLRTDTPSTGRHRAEVTKLLVRRDRRRRGVAAALMATLEVEAAARGHVLLMLDTESGSPAEDAYRRLGWSEYGRVDDHAARPDGSLSGTTFFAKRLGARRADPVDRPDGAPTPAMHLELAAIVVDDYDPAISFFVEVLGFDLVEDSPATTTGDGRPKRWVVVRPRGARTGLLLARADGAEQASVVGRQVAGRVGFFLRVDDVDAAHARLSARGVRFERPPRSEAYGRVAVFLDIAGNRWDLLGPG